ncbi:MAG: polysaccharide export protein [Planctomycetota bacterium]|nr:MAG: polysaccharide export protein [Planctomycetota bacterium]REJ88807.1 MAG: polysaccharide export protein [Planctomycetota bacterium]REK29489.1 MAG: polysaccharide export protein [Planctomycetota bacterium]REK31854.1 MAG: polysaccharide export protein [Planctomycetota bacterium]
MVHFNETRTIRMNRSFLMSIAGLWILTATSGCYAPLHSSAVPARNLPESFRTPYRTLAPKLNYANLTVASPDDYLIRANDKLEVTIPDLFDTAEPLPLNVQVMASGEIQLPLAGKIKVAGLNLLDVQAAITEAYADDILINPKVNVTIFEKSTVDIVVLGEVQAPGVVLLPEGQNDVGHALAAAGGFTDDAADAVEVHRRVREGESTLMFPAHGLEQVEPDFDDPKKILTIPLRGTAPELIRPEDVELRPGDLVVVPSRRHEVFWVVGQLDDTNLVRFSVGDRERELGAGLLLPGDRDIDVVTAVAMAGYIDPIDSPTTVTVHRKTPDGEPLLIHVDLIKARYDRQETVMVQAGDVIYVNPDAHWYFRRHLDRIIDDLILTPYRFSLTRGFNL